MGTTIESSWENAQLIEENVKLRRLAQAVIDTRHDLRSLERRRMKDAKIGDNQFDAHELLGAMIAADEAETALRDALATPNRY